MVNWQYEEIKKEIINVTTSKACRKGELQRRKNDKK